MRVMGVDGMENCTGKHGHKFVCRSASPLLHLHSAVLALSREKSKFFKICAGTFWLTKGFERIVCSCLLSTSDRVHNALATGYEVQLTYEAVENDNQNWKRISSNTYFK